VEGKSNKKGGRPAYRPFRSFNAEAVSLRWPAASWNPAAGPGPGPSAQPPWPAVTAQLAILPGDQPAAADTRIDLQQVTHIFE